MSNDQIPMLFQNLADISLDMIPLALTCFDVTTPSIMTERFESISDLSGTFARNQDPHYYF
jgi:hypothetical protein